jgi:hypothetical protein
MRYYRCYLFRDGFHTVTTTIIKCADDDDARRQCRTLFAATNLYTSVEVWDENDKRWLCACPREEADAARMNDSAAGWRDSARERESGACRVPALRIVVSHAKDMLATFP